MLKQAGCIPPITRRWQLPGRLSSTNPNLQNIPIRTERGREVRKGVYSARCGHTIVSADYSQIELRIIAEISKDPNMMEAFVQNLDIHTATAANVYGIPLDEVTSTQRRNAKAVNFGIIYGQSAFGLSQIWAFPSKEAADIIDNYFAQYPGIKNYMSDTMNFARENGYVTTLMGRRRYLRILIPPTLPYAALPSEMPSTRPYKVRQQI